MHMNSRVRIFLLWLFLAIIPSGQVNGFGEPLMIFAPATATYFLPTALEATKWFAAAAVTSYTFATTVGYDVCYCAKNLFAWTFGKPSAHPAHCPCECHQQYSQPFLSYVQNLHAPAYINYLQTQLQTFKEMPSTGINAQRIQAIETTLANPNMVQRIIIHNAKQEAFLNKHGIPTGFMADPYQKQLFHEAEQLTQQNARLLENPLIRSYAQLNDLQSIEAVLANCSEVKLRELLDQKPHLTQEQFAQLIKDTAKNIQNDPNCRLITLINTSQRVVQRSAQFIRDGQIVESSALLDFAHAATGFAQKLLDYDMHIARGIARGAKNGVNPLKIAQNLGYVAFFSVHTIWTAGSQIVRSNLLGARLLLHKAGIGSEAALLADIRSFVHEIEEHNAYVDKQIDNFKTRYRQMSGPEFAGFLAEAATEYILSGKVISATVNVVSPGIKTLKASATRMVENVTEPAMAMEGVPHSALGQQQLFEAVNEIEPLVQETHIVNDAAKAPGTTEAKVGSEIVKDAGKWTAEVQETVAYNNTFKSQITNVTQKIKIEFLKDKIPHIFENRSGHLINTPENQQLLLDLASDPKNYFAKPDCRGSIWCEKILDDGRQLWAQVYDGQIRNGGINPVPHRWHPETGLSRFIHKNGKM